MAYSRLGLYQNELRCVTKVVVVDIIRTACNMSAPAYPHPTSLYYSKTGRLAGRRESSGRAGFI
jgi:hypothetical protein